LGADDELTRRPRLLSRRFLNGSGGEGGEQHDHQQDTSDLNLSFHSTSPFF
jgi:hypothetical protein